MAAVIPLVQILGLNAQRFTREENIFLEITLFVRICEELRNIFQLEIDNNTNVEEGMLDAVVIKQVVKDILISEEYSLEGIACYTQMPEEVICDVASGTNLTPSLMLSRKIIELHRSIRPKLYEEILRKITDEINLKK